MMLPVAVMGAAMLVSYQRAKAESLGFDAKGGLMERAERFIVLGIGLLFGEILIPVLWLMLVLTLATAVQRFVKVWRQGDVPRETPYHRRAERRRQLRLDRRTERRARLAARRSRLGN
jgi:CDP-diacylglycerol--glycerol-3-phosphate 3-phosphatidyltransferase